MGYVESNLIAGEQIVYRAKLHWAIFIPGIIFAPLLIGFVFLLMAFIAKMTTEMAVTNKRVIAKAGLISRRTLEMNLSKVENIGVHQNILARILGFGTVTVVGTGGTRESFKGVAAPLEFRRAVQVHTHATQTP